MNYHKPLPPDGYIMLRDGRDTTSPRDLVWVSLGHGSYAWMPSFKQTEGGFVLSADNAKLYKEPTKLEDYCFFRCKKA